MTILTWPDPRLNGVAAPVQHGERVREIVDAMFAELDRSPTGIGLAAPQIGIMKRIIVARVPLKHFGGTNIIRHVIINPVLTWHDKGPMHLGWEGCLSFPDKQVQVPRWRRIKVEGYDQRWNHHVVGANNELVARVLQHEMDHLDGRNLATYARIAYEIEEERKRTALTDAVLRIEAANAADPGFAEAEKFRIEVPCERLDMERLEEQQMQLPLGGPGPDGVSKEEATHEGKA
jgi:peptide deformylase